MNRTFYPDSLVGKVGFTPVTNELFHHRGDLGISSNVLLLLIALLRHVKHKRTECIKVPVSRICDDTGFSESTVRRTSKEAKKLGLVVVKGRSNTVNEYDVRPLFVKLVAATVPGPTSDAVPAAQAPAEARSPSINDDVLLRKRRLVAQVWLNEMTSRKYAHGIPDALLAAFGDLRTPLDMMRQAVDAVAAAHRRFDEEQAVAQHNRYDIA